ncbi:Zinc finger protein GAI-ASSOCIATED FACTOR 1 [Sesamum alatum]|uniref:Zinc finger protein GAI-ASSOCIATED FACTOR 1 n=1 Tax=Sesamum alatum TaxID=300844 RepID=A0AAE2C9E6_9LAMI|nr:Zinc finger protein GAI-ASSOCIATED FACTOR 1 [Sesamum alatum]
MSKFVQEFEDDDDQFQSSTIVTQSSVASPNPTETAADGSSSRSITTSKKKRNLPGNPDPDAEVVALSPRTLMATNRYICEVCHKGFQRDQNLQLHRRGHNLPWKLKQRTNTQVKKRVYVCPEPNCVHHDPSRALGDLTGIKKHYCRKHGEKKWKCDKCSKRYAVQSDWKAHAKICGTREYRCDCGTVFSRKDSFVTHRAFCDALSEENYKTNQSIAASGAMMQNQAQDLFSTCTNRLVNPSACIGQDHSLKPLSLNSHGIMIPGSLDPFHNARTLSVNSKTIAAGLNNSNLALGSAYTSATALLQKAAEMGSKMSETSITPILLRGFAGYSTSASESFQDGSSNGVEMYTAANVVYAAGNLESSEKTTGRGEQTTSFDIHHAGLYDLSAFMHSSVQNSNAISQRQVILGDDEKMTVDFLGVEPPGAGHSSFSKKRRYEDEIPELESIRPNLHDLHSGW